MNQNSTQPTVAIAGGGLAGLAAACALADSGFRVTLFERRPYLGGRASSYEHPGTGEVIDNCQHVLFRVCTNLVEFYRRIGVEDKIRWFDEMTFIEPGGRTSVMRASPLPAPLHTAPSFLGFPFLSAKDKLVISRAIAALTLTSQPDTGRSFLDWCNQHGQTSNAIERFWKPILVSALSEDLDLISISCRRAGRARVDEVAVGAPHGRSKHSPDRSLQSRRRLHSRSRRRDSLPHFAGNVLSRPVASAIRVSVSSAENDESETKHFDYLILALPFESLDRVLPQTPGSRALARKLSHFESSPITGIHLWFDRQITESRPRRPARPHHSMDVPQVAAAAAGSGRA